MNRKRMLHPERTSRDNPAWTDETFKRARPAREVLPKLFGKAATEEMLKPKGRPRSDNPRIAVSIRLPAETLAKWKATGPGWQTRMAEKLKRV